MLSSKIESQSEKVKGTKFIVKYSSPDGNQYLGQNQFEYDCAFDSWPNKAKIEIIHPDDFDKGGLEVPG